jgi:hypothetical protein
MVRAVTLISGNSTSTDAAVGSATSETNGVTIQPFWTKERIVGHGDFTIALTLGIIPDPNSILVVLYHESS